MSFPTNTYDAAIWYAKQHGFSVFPTHGIKTVVGNGRKLLACTCGLVECASPGKHPATRKGRNESSKDESAIQALWAGRTNLNVAIATGPESGIFVIDVDGQVGEESISGLEAIHGNLPKTLTGITGRGRHLFFKYPEHKVFNRTNCLGNSVDVRGEGGYVVAAPSLHISGNIYSWEDSSISCQFAPQWILNMVCSTAKAPAVYQHIESTNSDVKKDWTANEVSSMLDFLDPNMGYSDWINIGMALQDGGYSFDLWDNWSKGSGKYDNSTAFHWKSFKPSGGITMGTLVDAAMSRGWKPPEFVPEKVDWENHPARNWLIEIGAYIPIKDRHTIPKTVKEIIHDEEPIYSGFPVDLLNLDGVVGDTVRWICGTAIKPQPTLALLNTLACLGAIFGRRYASPLNTRTNLYTCGVAPTSEGKDHSRGQLKSLMMSAGLECFLASDDIKSGPGILTTLSKKASCIMMLDEFGLVLQSISGEKAAQHRKDIGEMFLKLYSSSGRVYTAGDYADKKMETVVLKDPNFCIYGTTTLKNYLLALKKISIEGGDLNRFIVLPGEEEPELVTKDIDRNIDEMLLDKWKNFTPTGTGVSALNSILITPHVTTVQWGNTKARIDQLLFIEKARKKAGKESGTGELWGRYREHVIKVAMIFAICKNPTNPELEMEHVALAEKIVSSAVEYVIELAINHMFENEIEKNKKAVLSVIRESGKKGVKRTDLTRRFGGLRSRDFDDIIKSLMEEDRIEAEVEKTATRPRILYVAI